MTPSQGALENTSGRPHKCWKSPSRSTSKNPLASDVTSGRQGRWRQCIQTEAAGGKGTRPSGRRRKELAPAMGGAGANQPTAAAKVQKVLRWTNSVRRPQEKWALFVWALCRQKAAKGLGGPSPAACKGRPKWRARWDMHIGGTSVRGRSPHSVPMSHPYVQIQQSINQTLEMYT